MVDLQSLVAVVTPLRYAACTDGGEYVGPCPFCQDGRDRFHVWPNREHPGWWCRQCGLSGDAVDFLRKYDGCSYVEACARLGIDPRQHVTAVVPRHPQEQEAPARTWQEYGRKFVQLAQEHLFGPLGRQALAYLHGRGLVDETIRLWGLGFSWYEFHEAAEKWDLPPTYEDGRRATVWRPLGILIPSIVDGVLWGLTIRRLGADPSPKYVHIPGSRSALIGTSTLAGREVAILTEGAFDAMLLHQEAGDLVDVATMGSATTAPAVHWLWMLRNARRILVAYDLDPAGCSGASQVAALSKRVRMVKPIGAKDLTEMHLAGGDLRSWTLHQLAKHGPRQSTSRPDQSDDPSVADGDVQDALDFEDYLRFAAQQPTPCPICGLDAWHEKEDGSLQCRHCDGDPWRRTA